MTTKDSQTDHSSTSAASGVTSALMEQVKGDLGSNGDLLVELGHLFADAGFELSIVGGPVRDAILGRLHGEMDLDLTTSARPDDIERLVKPWADKTWDIGKEFGTIGLRKRGQTLEITTYRSEEYEPSSRKPVVRFGDNLDGDLLRRDFTINAMAIRLPEFTLADPHSGMSDLAKGRLQTPSPATESFDDDPLRIMRAVRFVSQLDFQVTEEVFDAMSNMAQRLSIVSAERVQVELVKLICGNAAKRGVDLMCNTGVADVVLPEVPAMKLEIDEHHRHKDVYEHSLTVLQQAIDLESAPDDDSEGAVPRPDFVLRFAALMHDVGKPKTRRHLDDGGVSFHHHEVVGAKMTAKRMKALRFDTATTKAVCKLIELHLRFHGYGDQQWSDSAVRRYVTDAGTMLSRLHRLTRADCTTRNKRKAARLAARYDHLEERIAALAEQEELASIRPDLDGRRIMELLGIKPGPLVGRAYNYLLELRMEEGPLGEPEAERRLRAWWADHGDSPDNAAASEPLGRETSERGASESTDAAAT